MGLAGVLLMLQLTSNKPESMWEEIRVPGFKMQSSVVCSSDLPPNPQEVRALNHNPEPQCL